MQYYYIIDDKAELIDEYTLLQCFHFCTGEVKKELRDFIFSRALQKTFYFSDQVVTIKKKASIKKC